MKTIKFNTTGLTEIELLNKAVDLLNESADKDAYYDVIDNNIIEYCNNELEGDSIYWNLVNVHPDGIDIDC